MSNTTYDIPVTVAGVNAPSVSLINDAADARTFQFVSTVTSDQAKIYASSDGANFPPILNTTPLLTLDGNSPPRTLNDRSLKYRAVFSGSGVRSLKVRAGTCCAGGGGTVPSEHFNTLAFADFPAGGSIGLAPATVDQFAAFTFDQTTAGQTLTFPAPTDPTATYVRWVSNVGSADFVLYGLLVIAGASATLVWNGSAWVEEGIGTSTPLRSVLGAGGKNILDSNGVNTAIGNTETDVPGNALGLFAGSGGMQAAISGVGTLDLQTATGAVFLDSQGGAINIGNTLVFAKNVNVGNVTGSSKVNLISGTQAAGGGVGINQAAPKAQLDVNGAIILEPLGTPVADGTGSLGTAATTVDVTSTLEVNQTTPVVLYANMRLIQPPTNATARGRKLTIVNVGTAAFIVGDAVQKQGINLIPGTTPGGAASANKGQACTFIWNGTAWVPEDTGPGVPVQAANLADAAVNIPRAGRYTKYTMPAATLGAARVLTATLTGALIGDRILVTREDATANTLTINNNAAAALAVLPASKQGSVEIQYNGTDWVFLTGGAL